MKYVLVVLLLLGLGVLGGCTTAPPEPRAIASPLSTPVPTSSPAAYHKISAEEAKAMMGDGQPFVLLDVRTQEEFTAQRLGGALLIPDGEIVDRAETELADKGARILIYCRSGRRSALAAQALVDMGYTQVYDFGGILDWPYDTVGD